MAADIRFYLDENVQIKIADQLHRRGIEAMTTRDLDALGDSDENHLARASEMGYVLCTHDTDFVRMAAQGIPHTGIVFGRLGDHSIGDWVKHLALIHGVLTPEEMQNQVEYL